MPFTIMGLVCSDKEQCVNNFWCYGVDLMLHSRASVTLLTRFSDSGNEVSKNNPVKVHGG